MARGPSYLGFMCEALQRPVKKYTAFQKKFSGPDAASYNVAPKPRYVTLKIDLESLRLDMESLRLASAQ